MGYKVSILVPVYGVEQFIERCVRSLFGQTYTDLEYVLVNDCTPDKSIEIVKKVVEEYSDRKPSVRIINHERNRGLAATRNTALDNATGEFVCLVDSDDWMEPNAVELLVKKQLENDSDLVSGSRLVHYPEKDSVLQERQCQNKEEMTLQMMQRSWDHLITGRLVRKALFTDNGLRWNEGLDIGEDRYMTTLLAYHADRFDTVDAVVYHYERRNQNAITKPNDGQCVFRNNNQEYGNVLALMQFFSDKETVYQKACASLMMEQLKHNTRMALVFSSKEEFDRVVGVIDGCSDEHRSLIGWKQEGVKGWCLHNYYWKRMEWLGAKSVRFVKKRLSGHVCS